MYPRRAQEAGALSGHRSDLGDIMSFYRKYTKLCSGLAIKNMTLGVLLVSNPEYVKGQQTTAGLFHRLPQPSLCPESVKKHSCILVCYHQRYISHESVRVLVSTMGSYIVFCSFVLVCS